MRVILVVLLMNACNFPPTQTDTTAPDDTGSADDTGTRPETSDTGAQLGTSDTGAPVDTNVQLDTGDTANGGGLWRDVRSGSYYFGADSGDSGSSIFDCATVVADLVTDQAGLDAFTQDYAYGIDLTGTVDFATEVAVTGYMNCGHGGEDIEVVDVRANGDVLEVDYQIIVPGSYIDVPVTAFSVIAVAGTQWTSVVATSTLVSSDSGDSGDSGP